MAKISNIDKADITSGGKYNFTRKQRKKNITIPLDVDTIELINKQTNKYRMSRCELLRSMIEFASKNSQFALLMEQL
jgi:hypothetical protein